MSVQEPVQTETNLAGARPGLYSRFTTFLGRYPKSSWAVFIALFVFPLYFPINLLTSPERAITLHIDLDDAIPFVPSAIWIYSLVYLSAFFPLLVVRSERLFHRMAITYVAVMMSCFAFFLVMPVTTAGFRRRGDLDITNFADWGLYLQYHFDPPFNCFPSLHVAVAFAGALCCLKADRLIGGLATVVATLIAISTTLVKQHYVADVVGGVILALIVWRVVLHPYRPESEAVLARRYPRWFAALFVPFYLTVVLVMYIAYRQGWKPWEAL